MGYDLLDYGRGTLVNVLAISLLWLVLYRILQAASARVLLVEVLVSAAILLLTLGSLRNRSPQLAAAIASLLAYASLALCTA